MNQLTALILGLLQGLLEWLPISSRGNLVLLMIGLFGMEPAEALSLSIYLHVGTGLAAILYFRREIIRILSEPRGRVFSFLLIATLATGAFGFPLYLYLGEISLYGESFLALIGGALIINGMVQRTARSKGTRGAESLRIRDGAVMGLVQGVSAVPGVSRSGVTTSALLFKGFSGEDALRISFLMSIPASFASGIGLILIEGFPRISLSLMTTMVAASFLAGFLSIGILLRIARRVRFWSLCVFLGLLTILPLLSYLR